MTTAKTHLENIFQKTGVRRQADLMRLAARVAAPARLQRNSPRERAEVCAIAAFRPTETPTCYGEYEFSTGAVTVDGSGSNWTNTGIDLSAGNGGAGGNGSLTISNGGSVDTEFIFEGGSAPSSATLLIESGGSLFTKD